MVDKLEKEIDSLKGKRVIQSTEADLFLIGVPPLLYKMTPPSRLLALVFYSSSCI